MKKILLLCLVLVMYLAGCGNSSKSQNEQPEGADKSISQDTESSQEMEGQYKDGSYEGVAVGYAGGLKVEVTVDGGKISEIEILEHNETVGKHEDAAEQIPKAIIQAQSIEVDDVSGCTMTSRGIKKAVKAALKDAGK